MGSELLKAGMAAVIVGVAGASTALAADAEVVIGNLDDLSGVYSDDGGPGSVEAEKMAIADFGGTVLGRNSQDDGRHPGFKQLRAHVDSPPRRNLRVLMR